MSCFGRSRAATKRPTGIYVEPPPNKNLVSTALLRGDTLGSLLRYNSIVAQYAVVGGGGGGGITFVSGVNWVGLGGGGGGGGVLEGSVVLEKGDTEIVVGAGGAVNAKGGDSEIIPPSGAGVITAVGGGRGGNGAASSTGSIAGAQAGGAGGSGGGGGGSLALNTNTSPAALGGTPIAGQGFTGGTGGALASPGPGLAYSYGGSGGGSSGTGRAGGSSMPDPGAGRVLSLLPGMDYGVGGTSRPTGKTAGLANSGRGGDCDTAGGSGRVVIRYSGPQVCTGGTVTSVTSGGVQYTLHVFDASGTLALDGSVVPAVVGGFSLSSLASFVGGGVSISIAAAGFALSVNTSLASGSVTTGAITGGASLSALVQWAGGSYGGDVSVTGFALSVGASFEGGDAGSNIPVGSITYSQSSVYPGVTAANNAIMTDGSFTNTGTATNNGGPSQWVQMDLGGSYAVGSVIIGTATNNIPGGWSAGYTANLDVQWSVDGSSWTTFMTTPVEPEGIYTYSASFTARYIRIGGTVNVYIALSEFYALSPGQTYP